MRITKETIRRALRTCLQVALSYIATNIFVVDFSEPKQVIKGALIGLAVAALSTGIAAAMNLERVEDGEN